MLIEERNEPQLKTWLTERLDKISDADSDVLADYVIALVKSDDSEAALRKNCVDNLEDFVKDRTNGFVDDVFSALKSKSYIPGYKPPLQRPQKLARQSPPPRPNPRKRGYVDRDDPNAGEANGYGRIPKMPRRGATGAGAGRGRGSRNQGRPSFPQPDAFQGGFVPMDPRNAMNAMATLQAMGFPVPQLPPQDFQQMFSNPSAGRGRARQRCRNYDTKGFCEAGINCPYEHGSDAMVVANNNDGMSSLAEIEGQLSELTTKGYNGSGPRQQRNGKLSKRQRKAAAAAATNGQQPNQRASYSSNNPSHSFQNSTLVVEHVPAESYNDSAIKEFFGQFGNIKALDLRDPRRYIAVIEFESHSAAQQAYDSPKAIFDNRFVKVFWYRPRHDQADVSMQEPSFDPSDPAFLEKQATAQASFEERRRKAEEAKKAREELEQRVKEHADAKRKLLSQLAERTGEAPPADEMPDAEGEGKTEALRAQLAALEQEAKTMGLNTEDAGAPAFRYSATVRGRGSFPSYRGRASRGVGRGSFRGGAASAAGGVTRLDNRPKSVSVTPVKPADDDAATLDFAADEKLGEALRTFLFSVGSDVAEVRFESSSPNPNSKNGDEDSQQEDSIKDKAVIVFRERYQAEAFVDAVRSAGYDVPGLGRVELAWVANSPLQTQSTASGNAGVETTDLKANAQQANNDQSDEKNEDGKGEDEDEGMEDGEVEDDPDDGGVGEVPQQQRSARRYAADTEQDFDVAE